MDEYVKNMLETWGMQVYIENFRAQEIDETVFNNLTEDDIKTLIPTVGSRRKFVVKLNEHLSLRNLIDTSDIILNLNESTSTISISDVESATSGTGTSGCETYSGSNEFQVNHLYKQNATLGLPYDISRGSNSFVGHLITNTEEGKLIAASYQKDKNFLRTKLCELIIKTELKENKDKRISSSRFIELATQINEVFPHEQPEIYYVPYVNAVKGKPKAARGKLWSAYIYLRANYKKYGFIKSQTKEETVAENTVEINEDEDSIQWLKNNVEPFIKVQEYWDKTFATRRNFNGTIKEYFKTFPCLKLPLGYLLLEQDFNQAFKNKENIFFTKWAQVYSIILNKAEKKNDSYLKEILNKHNKDEYSEDANQLFCLNILPLLFTCVNLKAKKVGNRWKPSKSEMKDGFLLHLNNINELDQALEIREKRYFSFGFTNQPVPVIVGDIGDIKESYVIIDSVRYKTETPLKAVDLCFKIYHALNAQYPVESEIVWTFIQRGIYNIDTKSDRKYVCVSTLLSDIEQYLDKAV